MSEPIINRTITVGNLLTIVTLVVSLIVTVTVYKGTVDQHSVKLQEIEQNQKILEGRIQLLEQEMNANKNSLIQIKQSQERSETYLELLLDKQGIKYVK